MRLVLGSRASGRRRVESSALASARGRAPPGGAFPRRCAPRSRRRRPGARGAAGSAGRSRGRSPGWCRGPVRRRCATGSPPAATASCATATATCSRTWFHGRSRSARPAAALGVRGRVGAARVRPAHRRPGRRTGACGRDDRARRGVRGGSPAAPAPRSPRTSAPGSATGRRCRRGSARRCAGSAAARGRCGSTPSGPGCVRRPDRTTA
jgi:hypothetical protein